MLLITTHSQFHNLHSTKFIVVSVSFFLFRATSELLCVELLFVHCCINCQILYTFFCKMSKGHQKAKFFVFYCFFLFSYFFKVQNKAEPQNQNPQNKTQNSKLKAHTKHKTQSIYLLLNSFRRVKKFFCPFLLSISCCAVCPRLPCCALACPISCPNSFFFY